MTAVMAPWVGGFKGRRLGFFAFCQGMLGLNNFLPRFSMKPKVKLGAGEQNATEGWCVRVCVCAFVAWGLSLKGEGECVRLGGECLRCPLQDYLPDVEWLEKRRGDVVSRRHSGYILDVSHDQR